MTEEYVREQIEIKRAEWEKRYMCFKIEVDTETRSSCFEHNLISSLLPMMLLRDEILELENVLLRINAEKN